MPRLRTGLLLLLLAVPAWAEPPDDGKRRTDLYGDPLPEGAIARMGTVRFRNGYFHFSPDGKVMALHSHLQPILLCDAATGKELRAIRGEGSAPHCFGCFSPDGRVLTTGDIEGKIWFWDVATRKPLKRLAGHGKPRLAGLTGKGWEDIHLKMLRMAFAADGKTLASWSCDQTLRVWDAATGKEVRKDVIEGNDCWYSFSSDGKALAAIVEDQHAFRFFDVATGKEGRTLPRTEGRYVGFEFSPDCELVGLLDHNTIRVFETATTREVWMANLTEREWAEASFSPDRKSLACKSDKSLNLRDARTGKVLKCFEGKLAYAVSLAFLPDSKTLAVMDMGAIRLWDVATGRERPTPEGHYAQVVSLAFAAHGKMLISGSDDGTLRSWDTATARPVPQSRAPWGGHHLAVSADGKVAVSGSTYGNILVCDMVSGRLCHELTNRFVGGGNVPHVPLALSTDGRKLASIGHSNSSAQGFGGGNGGRPAPVEGSGESSGGFDLWDVTQGKVFRTIKRSHHAASLAFSPDGKTIAVAGGYPRQQLELWDVASGKEFVTIPAKGLMWPSQVTFSPDGKLLAMFDSGRAIVWELTTRKQAARFDIPMGSGITSVSCLPDGRVLAIARDTPAQSSSTNVAEIWDLLAAKRVHMIPNKQGYFTASALSPDGNLLATGCQDTSILLWDLSPVWKAQKATPAQLQKKELDQLWTDLANEDAAQAFQAIRALIGASTDAVLLLKDRLPAAAEDPIARLVAALDHDEFAVRRKAYAELAKLGPEAEPYLRSALEGKPSAEVQRRAETLLRAQETQPRRLPPQLLREMRAVQVLEAIGTVEARQSLKTLATGAASAPLTREAKASLERLEKRSAK
jgi:WD40 repeat protein